VKVLAIEISSAEGSVAVAEHGQVVATRRFACERGRGAEVFAALAATRESWKDAAIIAVGIGPGSYNGLRVACAIATSLQMAGRAEIRLSPSPCLLPVDEPHFFVCGDARGGRAYRAEVRARRLRGEIALLPYAEAAAAADGAAPVVRVGSLPGGENLPASSPDAAVLALLAPDLPATGTGPIEPIYLKPPHITLPRKVAT
jgi:tRNA threonylcarbamoyl adenosine modification protein YeaZ